MRSEELRRNGWTVTLSNDQNGVAAAIEQVLGVRSVAPASSELDRGQDALGQPARCRRYKT